ncbi:helix-turn-helix domain-containing protein [Aquimarina addita]|uniref:helix-turn-helix domain-containing protein n=1 Tax=Aquimarina addita TaxID=870485 RepID=UPI0031E58D10
MSNLLLSTFLLVTATDISVFFYSRFMDLPAILEMLRIQISDFKDPLLFLYFLSLIYSDFKLKTKHLIHTAPWLISMIILTPNFFLVSHDDQIIFLQNFGQSEESVWLRKKGYLLEIVYLIAEIYYIIRYRSLLLENFTDKTSFYKYRWLKQLLIFILIGQALTFTKGIIRETESDTVTNVARVFLLSYGLFFTFWLVLKALYSPKLFRGIPIELKLSKEIMAEKVVKNEASDAIKNQIIVLKEYMDTEAPYLNPSLTVQKLAFQTGLPAKELSVLINQHLNQHFFDFINSYRIKKATEILSDTSKKQVTVLEILYEVGFNSKSSFNTAFKKHTGTTPTAYRKSN